MFISLKRVISGVSQQFPLYVVMVLRDVDVGTSRWSDPGAELRASPGPAAALVIWRLIGPFRVVNREHLLCHGGAWPANVCLGAASLGMFRRGKTPIIPS